MIKCNGIELIKELRKPGQACVCIQGTEILVAINKADLIDTINRANNPDKCWMYQWHDNNGNWLQIAANN